jgi:hypothetical protein
MPDWIVIFLVMLGTALGVTGTLLVGYLWWSRRRFVLLKEALVTLTEQSARELLQARSSLTLQSTIVAQLRNEVRNAQAGVQALMTRLDAEQEPAVHQDDDPRRPADPDDDLASLDSLRAVEKKSDKPERSTMWARLRDNIQDI